eukprot:355527-Chlamydomonas_euryale.AAC.1
MAHSGIAKTVLRAKEGTKGRQVCMVWGCSESHACAGGLQSGEGQVKDLWACSDRPACRVRRTGRTHWQLAALLVGPAKEGWRAKHQLEHGPKHRRKHEPKHARRHGLQHVPKHKLRHEQSLKHLLKHKLKLEHGQGRAPGPDMHGCAASIRLQVFASGCKSLHQAAMYPPAHTAGMQTSARLYMYGQGVYSQGVYGQGVYGQGVYGQ